MRVTFADVRQPEQYWGVVLGPNGLFEVEPIVEKARVLFDKHVLEVQRLKAIDLWYKGSQPHHSIPSATTELQKLLELSRTPWLGLVVTTIAQAMYVDGFRSPETGETVKGPWETWNGNGMARGQTAIHRAALGYGYSYTHVQAGKAQNGEARSVIRGLSPKRCYAAYDDPSWDEWAQYAITVDNREDNSAIVKLYDDTFTHTLKYAPNGTTQWLLMSSIAHGAGCVPIIRYTNQLDLDGNTPGEVEPFVETASRIDKGAFDRLLTQHYNSWKKLWIAGLTKPNTAEQARLEKLKLRQNDILNFEDPDTKVGWIPETDLGGFISAIESDIEHLAAISQLPNHLLTGKMVNLSAEALSAARAPLTQKVFERQVSFGQSHNQTLRLAAKLAGDEAAANDLMSHVTWQDMEIRSLAQAADALGKMAETLGVPRQALWRKIPGTTQLDWDEWEAMLLDDDEVTKYLRELNDKQKQAATGPGANNDPNDTALDVDKNVA